MAAGATPSVRFASEGLPVGRGLAGLDTGEVILQQHAAVGTDDLQVAELSLCAPGGESHAVADGRSKGVVADADGHDARTYIICHDLLHMIGRSAETLTGVEANHVRTPGGVVLVDEDGCIRTHDDQVGVALQALHIDGFAQSCREVAVDAIALGDSVFADVDLGTIAVVAVVLREVLLEPRRRAVVVLIEDVHGVIRAPRGLVGAPRLDISDNLHLRIFLLDGAVELDVALEVVFALVLIGIEVEIGILIADFQQSQSEGLGVSVLRALGSPLGGLSVTICVLDGIESFLNVFLNLVVGLQPSVTEAYQLTLRCPGRCSMGPMVFFHSKRL